MRLFIHSHGHLAIPSLPQTSVPHLWNTVLMKKECIYLASLRATSVCCLCVLFQKDLWFSFWCSWCVFCFSGKYFFQFYLLYFGWIFHSHYRVLFLFFDLEVDVWHSYFMNSCFRNAKLYRSKHQLPFVWSFPQIPGSVQVSEVQALTVDRGAAESLDVTSAFPPPPLSPCHTDPRGDLKASVGADG